MPSDRFSAANEKSGNADSPNIEFEVTKIFINHRDYIHRNPVERQLVIAPCEYRYCSAFPGFKLDSWPSAAKADISRSA